jgi:hypothetical protein
MSDKELTDIVENEDYLDESAALETLKPNPTRTEMLATMTSLLAQLKGEDLSHFFNDSIKKYSPDGVPSATAPGGAPALGQMPAATMGAMKEDVAEMFSGDDLSEEFKERASTIFEAAVTARMNLETVRLEEEFAAQLDEAVVAVQEEMTEKVDQYLDYVVEQWIEENKLAIEASIRTNVTEDFMEGLRNLFAESYINVPDEKLDVLGELQAHVDELEGKLDESVNKQLELQAILDEAIKEATFDEVSEGLAATQVEKLRTLAEGIDFSDADAYVKKLNIIKDKYFSEKKEVSTGVVTEEADAGVDQRVEVPAHMANYVASISRNAK